MFKRIIIPMLRYIIPLILDEWEQLKKRKIEEKIRKQYEIKPDNNVKGEQ